MNKEIIQIDINKVIPNIYQPRKYFNEESIQELAQSISQHGIIQPLTVRKCGDIFELVAGERRLRAAKMINLEYVPCNIVDITDTESAEIALLENLQREDLNYIEEAEAYFNLINEHNFTQSDLAKRIGKKQSTIANKMRLLKLNKKVRDLCLSNNLTERHARALLTITDEKLQIKIVNKIIAQSLNVKKTEELINKELLKLTGNKIKKKRQIKGVIPGKLYLNTIKQVFKKFDISAEYNCSEDDDYIELKVKIPKVK